MLRLPAGREASRGEGAPQYQRHRPERTLLYQLVERYYPVFETQWAAEGRILPDYVRQEFEEYLKCGRLEHGFLRVRCDTCHAEHLVAFRCKRRGFCPSCGARRMAESAALLVDDVLPHEPMATPAHPCARGIGASMHIIACIEDPVVIEKILTHRNEKALPIEAPPLPRSRAPPQAGLFD